MSRQTEYKASEQAYREPLEASKTYWFSKKAKPTSCCLSALASIPMSDSNASGALMSRTGIGVTASWHSIVPEKNTGGIRGCCGFDSYSWTVSGMGNNSVRNSTSSRRSSNRCFRHRCPEEPSNNNGRQGFSPCGGHEGIAMSPQRRPVPSASLLLFSSMKKSFFNFA